jgi:hypothetical protein
MQCFKVVWCAATLYVISSSIRTLWSGSMSCDTVQYLATNQNTSKWFNVLPNRLGRHLLQLSGIRNSCTWVLFISCHLSTVQKLKPQSTYSERPSLRVRYTRECKFQQTKKKVWHNPVAMNLLRSHACLLKPLPRYSCLKMSPSYGFDKLTTEAWQLLIRVCRRWYFEPALTQLSNPYLFSAISNLT